MKKLLTAALTAALGMAFAASALATETRINSLSAAGGLGGAFNEKTITIHDSTNINTFPQYMVNYKNSVDVDNTAGSTYGSMNIRYALSDDPAPPVLMLFGKRSPWQAVTNTSTIGGLTPQGIAGGMAGYSSVIDPATGKATYSGPADPTNQQFGIGFGMKVGEAVRLGATLSIGGNRKDKPGVMTNTGNAYDDEESNTWIDFNAGVGFDINEVNSLDFGLNVMAGTFTNTDNNNLIRFASNGLYGIALTAKGEFMVSQISKIVPFLRVNYDSRSVVHQSRSDESGLGNESKQGTVSNLWFIMGTDLAIAPPNMEGVLIQPGIGFIYHGSNGNGTPAAGGTATDIQENSNNLMPWYGFAAEAKAFEWLFLRLGARQVISRTNFNNTATTPANNETHYSTVTNSVSTGLGIKLMGWDLDLNINPAFFNNGLAVVNGQPTGAPAGAAPGASWAMDWALGYDW